jgi:uncharacterized membrane protein YccF (DUF307 family)
MLTRTRNLESMVSVGNVLWVVFFGWILYIGYALAALVMCITIAGIPYGTIHTCVHMPHRTRARARITTCTRTRAPARSSPYTTPAGRLCWKLKDYYLWPFGKYIVVRHLSINTHPHTTHPHSRARVRHTT